MAMNNYRRNVMETFGEEQSSIPCVQCGPLSLGVVEHFVLPSMPQKVRPEIIIAEGHLVKVP
jgi:hypothetical protein